MIISISIVAFGATVLVGVGRSGGYRLNLSPSAPVGIWRIETLNRPLAIGDPIFICPPATSLFVDAFGRGYLSEGTCLGGFAPLLKTVAALPGQNVEIGNNVVIDGRPLPASRVRHKDSQNRAIEPFPGGTVPPGHLFLHSSIASSYDSRYFGPIPAAGLLGRARPVLTVYP